MATDLANEYKNDPGMRRVALGIDTEHFITKNKVGIYLVERAHQCRMEAIESLIEADPNDYKTVADLQYKAKIPDMFLTWLEEAIAHGINEEESIRAEDFGA